MKLKHVLNNLHLRFVYNTSVKNSPDDIIDFLTLIKNEFQYPFTVSWEKPTHIVEETHDIQIYLNYYGFRHIIKAFKTIKQIRKLANTNLRLLTGCGYIGAMLVMDEDAVIEELMDACCD